MTRRLIKYSTPYNTPLSDEWNTPKYITDMVGLVDFDPFSNAESTVSSVKRGGLDIGVDGFALSEWPNIRYASVFMNPPFSQMGKAVKVLNQWLSEGDYRGEHLPRSAVVVHKADLTTKWFRDLATLRNVRVMIPPKRINFVSSRGSSSNFCSVVTCVGPCTWFEALALEHKWLLMQIV